MIYLSGSIRVLGLNTHTFKYIMRSPTWVPNPCYAYSSLLPSSQHLNHNPLFNTEMSQEKDLENEEVAGIRRFNHRWARMPDKLSTTLGVESRGIVPVPLDERINKPYSKNFFIWFSTNFNILSLSSGTLGPVIFGLGLRDACITILFANLLCCAFPSYITTWGPKLGMRQMIISRYSFGYYGVMFVCILNLIGMIGFAILNCIVGGQALASVANGNMSWSVGIVIVTVISLLVSFCGFKVLNWYERISWLPVLITFLIASIVGRKHLSSPPPAVPPTVSTIFNFIATLAGFTIGYSSISCDFTNYYQPDVSSWKIFLSTYAGLILSIIPLQCLGAAIVVAASSVPLWEQGYINGNVGGLLEAMLLPLGNFGKFLTVLLSLSVAGNNAAVLYSTSINLQVLMPIVAKVPRYVFSVVATAIIVPVSIVGAHRFYDTLLNFLGIVGYWGSAYNAIILTEHFYFRNNDISAYDGTAWNIPKRLPSGISAVAASIFSFALVIPCMNQVWFTGPIARTTGDIGFEVAFLVSGLLYFLFRWFGIRWREYSPNGIWDIPSFMSSASVAFRLTTI